MVVDILIANADPHAVVILVWVGTKIVYEKFGLLRQLEAELLHCLGLGLGLRLRSRLGLRLRLRLGLQYGQVRATFRASGSVMFAFVLSSFLCRQLV